MNIQMLFDQRRNDNDDWTDKAEKIRCLPAAAQRHVRIAQIIGHLRPRDIYCHCSSSLDLMPF